MIRIGLKNINYITEDIPKLYNDPDILEIYSTIDLTESNLLNLNNLLKKIKPKSTQIHISKLDNLLLLNKLIFKNMEIWLEIENYTDLIKYQDIVFNLKNTFKLILNIKCKDMYNIDETSILKNTYLNVFNEIYICDINLYSEQDEPSKLFQLRDKLMLTSNTPTKYCKMDQTYLVYDFKKLKYNPCIDLDIEFNIKSDVSKFQMKRIPNISCNYFCNKYVYIFEEKLKRKIK